MPSIEIPVIGAIIVLIALWTVSAYITYRLLLLPSYDLLTWISPWYHEMPVDVEYVYNKLMIIFSPLSLILISCVNIVMIIIFAILGLLRLVLRPVTRELYALHLARRPDMTHEQARRYAYDR